MATINTYLNFPGNTEEAFNFYKSIFGGEFVGGISRFKDSPEADKIPGNERDKVMHVALPVGNGNMLMGTDALESMGQSLTQGNNIFLSLATGSQEEADPLFNKLSAGGEVVMPPDDMFWGAYFGMCIDKFGIQWMVTYDNKQQ